MKKLILIALAVITLSSAAFAATLLNFPSGVNKYTDQYGTAYYPNASGQVSVTGDITPFLKAGFTLTPSALVGQTYMTFNNSTSASQACTKGQVQYNRTVLMGCYSTAATGGWKKWH